MKVGVIGGRDFKDYDLMVKTLDSFKSKITLIVSGHAQGADILGERYAKENEIETKIFVPDWEKFGKSAGFIRNSDIINEAELIFAFWNNSSRGTKDSIDKANKLGKPVIIINYV